MTQEMRTDVELLVQLLNEAPLVHDRIAKRHVVLCVKQLSSWTGLAAQTISDYRTGKTNIPIDFWRRITEHWIDGRIVALLLGDAATWELILDDPAPPETGKDFFRAACEEMGAYHRTQTYIAELLADRRVDELDEATIQHYNDAYIHHRELGARLHRAINRAYVAAVGLHGARA